MYLWIILSLFALTLWLDIQIFYIRHNILFGRMIPAYVFFLSLSRLHLILTFHIYMFFRLKQLLRHLTLTMFLSCLLHVKDFCGTVKVAAVTSGSWVKSWPHALHHDLQKISQKFWKIKSPLNSGICLADQENTRADITLKYVKALSWIN